MYVWNIQICIHSMNIHCTSYFIITELWVILARGAGYVRTTEQQNLIITEYTVCPGSSDPPEKILNIFASENEVYTIF